MPISQPSKVVTPWATSGLKNTIPQNADPVNGLAGYDQGFPPINMQPKTAGGIPPFGQDFNGVFFDLTRAVQFQQAGGSFPYDSAWATAVGGYPVGALVSRSDNSGMWRNTVANNVSNPESGGAGWQPEDAGATSVTMTNANVTLTALQAARSVIIITGALTANLQLIFPAYVKQWQVVNGTTGNFTITCKTAAGSGLALQRGQVASIVGDGTNITGMDFSSLLAVNGWQRLSSGLIIQWGTSGAMSGSPFASVNVTFPIAFPNEAVACVAMSTGAGVSVSSNGPALTSVGLINSTAATSPAKWLAIGY